MIHYIKTILVEEEVECAICLTMFKKPFRMLQPGENEKNLHNIVMTITPNLAGILATLGSSTGCGSVAANPCGGRNVSPRARSVAEAVITRNVMVKLRPEMEAVDMWRSFRG